MKITVFSTKNFEKPYIEKQSNHHDVKMIEAHLSKDSVEHAKGSDGVVLFTTDDASGKVLEDLDDYGIKYLATRSAGFDHIDVDKAKELNMRVSVVPEYSPNAIAEHAVGMMLALNRKLMLAQRNVHDYDFRLDGLIGFDMNGKTIGILGAGKIGSVTVKILNGFGCKILIYDPVQNKELIEKYNAEYVGMDELCENSDVIAIHAPLNEKTKHLINKDTINKMKKGVMIVNTGRGAIVKTEDLIEGLKNGQIGSAGLDVYEYEKGLFFNDHADEVVLQDTCFAELLAFKNVIITGHQAFLTNTALKNMSGTAFENLTLMTEGKECNNEI